MSFLVVLGVPNSKETSPSMRLSRLNETDRENSPTKSHCSPDLLEGRTETGPNKISLYLGANAMVSSCILCFFHNQSVVYDGTFRHI